MENRVELRGLYGRDLQGFQNLEGLWNGILIYLFAGLFWMVVIIV